MTTNKKKEDFGHPVNIAIDTSGRIGSVAIGIGERILGWQRFSDMMMHSTELFPTIKSLLFLNNIETRTIKNIFITIGPGSFTGLRISVTAAKIMQLANKNIKIYTVSTLDGLAENIIPKTNYLVGAILDAKRGQFFTAIYEPNGNNWTKIVGDSLQKADEFLSAIGDKKILLLGEGLVYYRKEFERPNVDFANEDLWTINACNVYKIGLRKLQKDEFEDPLCLAPNYLRLPI